MVIIVPIMDLNNPLSIWILMFAFVGLQLLFVGIYLYLSLKILKIQDFKLKRVLITIFLYNILSFLFFIVMLAMEPFNLLDSIIRLLLIFYLVNKQVKPLSLTLKVMGLVIGMAIVTSIIIAVSLPPLIDLLLS